MQRQESGIIVQEGLHATDTQHAIQEEGPGAPNPPESAASPIMTLLSDAWTMRVRAFPRVRDALSTCRPLISSEVTLLEAG